MATKLMPVRTLLAANTSSLTELACMDGLTEVLRAFAYANIAARACLAYGASL